MEHVYTNRHIAHMAAKVRNDKRVSSRDPFYYAFKMNGTGGLYVLLVGPEPIRKGKVEAYQHRAMAFKRNYLERAA